MVFKICVQTLQSFLVVGRGCWSTHAVAVILSRCLSGKFGQVKRWSYARNVAF